MNRVLGGFLLATGLLVDGSDGRQPASAQPQPPSQQPPPQENALT